MSYYQLLEALKEIMKNKEPWEKVRSEVYFETPEGELYEVSFMHIDSEGDIILS